MNLKKACRMCCSHEDVTYDLFSPCEGGVSLAEELYSLVNIKITKEDELPESICANCYRVNTFFKDYKKNCSQVNDYLKKKLITEKSSLDRISIKKEKEDDYVDHSVDPADKPANDAGSDTDTPYPIALIHSTINENLDQLQCNFLDTKSLREEAAASLPESTLASEDAPPQRGEKRKLDNADDMARKRRSRIGTANDEDYLNHVVKQEEVDIYDSPVEDFNDVHSLEDPRSPEPSHLSDDAQSARSPSSSESGEESCTSSSSCSTGDSDEEAEMFMLLALLL